MTGTCRQNRPASFATGDEGRFYGEQPKHTAANMEEQLFGHSQTNEKSRPPYGSLLWTHRTELQLSIYEERNIIGCKPTSLMRIITSFARSAILFLCAGEMRNAVPAALEMLLTFGQTISCLRHK